ncbi:lachesin-like isoform X1 [Centruroides sculpturatus]|uniref:lachesin-like isoform X1 n=1 Tax=Centruroides sculpturatus TaxID=218467 RepID=UPI000C6E291F|nr:lachesin-like isoform X1 [Centruroides sculpturatus]
MAAHVMDKWLARALVLVLLTIASLTIAGHGINYEEEPFFAEPIQNVTVALSRDAQLTCIVDNLGTYRVAWIKVETKAILTIHNHIITRNYRISLSHNDNRHFVLHIKNVQKSDKGGYMCQINTAPMKSQVGYLDVLVPPDILVKNSSSDVISREGSNVSLTCKAAGYPTPNISWRREDNEKIPLGMWQGRKVLATTYDGEFLNITRVSRLHMGAYLCIASNGVPPSVSRRIMLHVDFPPVMWIPNQLVGAPMGKDVTLDCHTEAYPQSINFWSKEKGEILLSNDKYEIVSKKKLYKTHMRLTIRTLNNEDFDTYKCYSKNSLGETEGVIRLYEIPPPTIEPNKDANTIRRQSSEAFPQHQSLGSSHELGENDKRRQSHRGFVVISDGSYHISEDVKAALEDHSLSEKNHELTKSNCGTTMTILWNSLIFTLTVWLAT